MDLNRLPRLQSPSLFPSVLSPFQFPSPEPTVLPAFRNMFAPLFLLPLAITSASAIPVQRESDPASVVRRNDSYQSTIPDYVYRTRAQSAVNLGFWLVGERYGVPDHYAECGADPEHNDEYVLAKSCSKQQKENFWNTFITEDDFAIMERMGINTVRLPIGYWTVGRQNCHCEDTPFWQYMDVYDNQWSYVEKAISWAATHGIGVLIDFHGAEGSQNGWEHAGIDTLQATFLDHKAYQNHTTSVLEWIAQQIKGKPNVVGLEILNEPNPDDHARINPWYESTLDRLRPILGDDFPFYVSGSIFDQARIDWIRQQPGFLIMDYHMYPVFDTKYKDKSAEVQIKMMQQEYTTPFDNAAGVNMIIGEWSCTNPNNKADWNQQEAFCDAQMQILSRPSIGGLHYWSWKTQGDWFNTWSFLSSTGGAEGLSRVGGDARSLLIPTHGRNTFSSDGTASDFSTRGGHSKRNMFAWEQPDAVQIWDEGCRTAQIFGEFSAKLGFTQEWIKRQNLSSDKHTEEEYNGHFTRGLQDCES